MTQTVNRWITAGENCASIWHADWRCHMKIRHAGATLCQLVNMWRFHDLMASTSKPISTMLICHDVENIRTVYHADKVFALAVIK